MVRSAREKRLPRYCKTLNWTGLYNKFTSLYVFGKNKKLDGRVVNESLQKSRQKLAEVLKGIDDNSDDWAMPSEHPAKRPAIAPDEDKASTDEATCSNTLNHQLLASLNELKATVERQLSAASVIPGAPRPLQEIVAPTASASASVSSSQASSVDDAGSLDALQSHMKNYALR